MPSRKDKPQDPAPKSGAQKKGRGASKPSFSIGGTLPVERKTGWVYRSDSNAPPARSRTNDAPGPAPETPRAAAVRAPAVRASAPHAGGLARNQWKSWLAEGAEALLVPVEVALVLALAPLGARSSAGAKDRK